MGLWVVGHVGEGFCGVGCCWVLGWSSDGGARGGVVVVGLVFGVVVATVVVWKRERYGGLGIGLLNGGGGWLRERHRVREIERKREK